MVPQSLPVLRCESRRRRSEPRWGLVAAVVVLMASTLDALWLVPAQQRAAQAEDRLGPRVRCFDVVRRPPPAPDAVMAPTPAPARAPSPSAGVRVPDVLLLAPAAR